MQKKVVETWDEVFLLNSGGDKGVLSVFDICFDTIHTFCFARDFYREPKTRPVVSLLRYLRPLYELA
jgi:hypothetical protein